MKYIRTKDGIYEPTKWQCDLSNEMILVKANNKFGNDKIFARDIIKQANTIKELCDAFVIVGTNNDFYEDDVYKVYKDFIYARHAMVSLEKESHYDRDFAIYGAIWTDKGLQFAARMNSEGVLELL